MSTITHCKINGSLYTLSARVLTEIAPDVRFPTSLSGDGTDAMYDVANFVCGILGLI